MNKSDSNDQKRSPVDLFWSSLSLLFISHVHSGVPVFSRRSATPGEGPTHFFLNRALLRLNPALPVSPNPVSPNPKVRVWVRDSAKRDSAKWG